MNYTVKTVKGKKYVYSQESIDGKQVEKYMGSYDKPEIQAFINQAKITKITDKVITPKMLHDAELITIKCPHCGAKSKTHVYPSQTWLCNKCGKGIVVTVSKASKEEEEKLKEITAFLGR